MITMLTLPMALQARILTEDSFHALIACTHARILWVNMRRRWPLPDDDLLIFDGKEWLVTLLSKCSVTVRDMLILLLWPIWQTRNDISHGKEIALVLATVEYLDSYYKSIVLAGRYSTEEILKGKMPALAEAEPHLSLPPVVAPWPAPSVGLVVLSIDGSFLKDDGSAAASMIIINEKGEVMMATYRYLFNCNDPLEAELHAVMLGMALALQHFSLLVVLQSDSSEALSSLTNDALLRSAYGHLVLEIKALLGNREFYPLKINRSQNRIADRLAKYSRSERVTALWLGSVPPCIEDL
ncbi:Alpha-amylase [Hordeum vulgare]|nr:Alpha-amylase [Hordeum vulgare]